MFFASLKSLSFFFNFSQFVVDRHFAHLELHRPTAAEAELTCQTGDGLSVWLTFILQVRLFVPQMNHQQVLFESLVWFTFWNLDRQDLTEGHVTEHIIRVCVCVSALSDLCVCVRVCQSIQLHGNCRVTFRKLFHTTTDSIFVSVRRLQRQCRVRKWNNVLAQKHVELFFNLQRWRLAERKHRLWLRLGQSWNERDPSANQIPGLLSSSCSILLFTSRYRVMKPPCDSVRVKTNMASGDCDSFFVSHPPSLPCVCSWHWSVLLLVQTWWEEAVVHFDSDQVDLQTAEMFKLSVLLSFPTLLFCG